MHASSWAHMCAVGFQLSTGLALSWGGAGARSGGKFGTVTVGLLLSHPDGGAGIMATLII